MIVTPGQCHVTITAGVWDMDVTGDTLADLTITHGRTTFEKGRAAVSGSQFTIRAYEGAGTYWPLGGIGNDIVVTTGAGHTRHTGRISDLSWVWDEDGHGRYLAHRVTTTANMSRLGSLTPPVWPVWGKETVRARAEWVLANTWTETPWATQTGDFNPVMRQVDRDNNIDALAVLEGLMWEGETLLWDDVHGRVVWQEIGHRRTTPTINLPPCAVKWAPQYAARNDLVNAVELEYGPDVDGLRPTVTAGDNGAAFYWGLWAERYATDYHDQSSAQAKATRIVRRQARPQTLLPTVTVLPNLLEPAQWAAVAALRVGDRVRLPQLPEPVPDGVIAAPAVWVVEGWTERVGSRWRPDAEWTLDLHLSPPIWSMVSRRWDEVPGAWQDQGTTTWDQIGAL